MRQQFEYHVSFRVEQHSTRWGQQTPPTHSVSYVWSNPCCLATLNMCKSGNSFRHITIWSWQKMLAVTPFVHLVYFLMKLLQTLLSIFLALYFLVPSSAVCQWDVLFLCLAISLNDADTIQNCSLALQCEHESFWRWHSILVNVLYVLLWAL